MDSIAVFASFRYFWANDASIQSYLGVATQAAALKQILAKDATYSSGETNAKYPGLAIRMIDDMDDVFLPSNNVFMEVALSNSIKNNDSLLTLYRLKDRIKEITINKHSGEHKQDDINAQGQSLGLNPKIRGVFWVSAPQYDDQEQGSERLQRIICVMRLVIGD